MKSKRKLLSIILIFMMISYCLIALFSGKSYAVSQTISSNIDSLDDTIYPGIKERINTLKAKYPNWNFKILYTDLDWNEVITNEYVGHGSSPRNKVQAISNYQGEWICPCGYVDGSWRCASEAAIRYMMDPRNSLNASDVFQFEELTMNEYNRNQIVAMTNGTFLQGHVDEITASANSTGINPYFIIARLLQEQGKDGTALTSGIYGYYNPFNIQANGTDPIGNGVVYAKNQGWDTLEKGITGGINFLSKEYIKRGQNTLYLQKFDVENTYQGLYWHQYMQNVMAAQSEGTTLRKTYESVNAVGASHTFIIPVYRNMPQVACSRPNGNTSATVTGDLVRVNVNSTISLRSAPNGTKISAVLSKDEIVTRIEKATTKVAGTYWDKIRKADGTEAYVARETYDYESEYKLYLIPIEEGKNPGDVDDGGNNNNSPDNHEPDDDNTGNNQDSHKVKLEENSNIIWVTPDAIAQNLLDYFGGSVKIVKEDGSYLENEQSIIGTGYKVKDTYTVIKKGDITGDGIVDISDLLALQKHLLGVTNLSHTIKGESADLVKDESLDISDLLKMQKYLLGVSSIEV